MFSHKNSEKWQNATIIVRKYLTVSKRGSYDDDDAGSAAPPPSSFVSSSSAPRRPAAATASSTLGTTRR